MFKFCVLFLGSTPGGEFSAGICWISRLLPRFCAAMIEVVAKLVRGPVFLAGEMLECFVTFTNPLSSFSTSASSEMLAWASAQIHCQFHASENRVLLPPSEDSKHDVQAENETVFVPNRGERGQCILSTPPKILFCDLRLDPGESKSCLKDSQFPQDEDMAPSNPFLEEDEGIRKDSRLVDLATELLMAATSRRNLHLYNISNSRGKVGTFCIFKTVYKIGEDIIGTFNFSEGDIPCLQYCVSLQSEESVHEEFQRRRGQPVSYSTHTRHQESCLHTSSSNFSLPIPLSSTPGFSTNIVTLKWRLHFEFVTSREPVEVPTLPENHAEPLTWTGAEYIDVDTFSWNLPIKVLPTNPVLASYVSQISSMNSITL
ncbi:RAB6A-GEF complex partner protein 2 isoform X3 [Rhinatrema bivittatum]|uniref:RAB6A-GEF complex partner protein 2 isoform X3 n=1 Tax=Rhinatrema bivittatum TaxID=194408 RepID=UPI00112B30DA|nr:RAB6A-GEF complex partner protein 2 isoform X3 [Rhinatrema bivittatum]